MRSQWTQSDDVQRKMSQFKLSLQPVVQSPTGLRATFQVNLERSRSYLTFGWFIDFHNSPR